MSARLGVLLLVAAFLLVGCGSSNEAPDEDWAMSLCKRMVNHGLTDDDGNPVKPMAVVRARSVSVKDAAKLPGGDGFKKVKSGYFASCKVEWTEPDLISGLPLEDDAAVLVSERGDTAFVVDRF